MKSKSLSKGLTVAFSQTPAFTYREALLQAKRLHKSGKNLARILSYLKTTGKIFTIAKGAYATKKDNAVSGFAYRPFYYGLLYAMSIRDLWTQSSRPEIITTRAVRKSNIEIFNEKGNMIAVHHIPAKYFFGFDILNFSGMRVPVSDPEKTLIDLFYYRVKLPVQAYSGILKAVRMRKLKGYLGYYDSRVRRRIISFVEKYKPLADRGKLESPY